MTDRNERLKSIREPSEKALQIAAQCWCDEETAHKVMDVELAVAFAKRLDNDYSAIAELTERNCQLRALVERYEKALERYAMQTVTVVSGQCRLNFNGDSSGPGLNFYEGEEWMLGDKAREALEEGERE